MKAASSIPSFAIALTLCLAGASPAYADDVRVVRDVFATWGVLSNNVKVNRLVAKTAPNGDKTLGGNATAFGQTAGIEVSFGGGEVRRASFDFPARAKLTTEHFRQLFGIAPNQMFPGLGGGVGIKHLEVAVQGGRIQSAKVVTTFSTWAPMGAGSADKVVTMSAIESEFEVADLQGRPRVSAKVQTDLLLPGRLAKNLGIGQTSLRLSGQLKSKPLEIRLGVGLSSDAIPLDAKKTLVLKEAAFEFFLVSGKPGLALTGKLQLRPPNRPPLTLGGLVSIDVAGTVYAEGYMDKADAQPNPFGISKALTLERAGLGFGANFATAIPTPILAVEGGLKFRDRRGQVRSGFATIGIDTGNPTRNMVDAELAGLSMTDFVDAFGGVPVPRELAATLQTMALTKLRVTVVPPGPGVKLFGVDYEPGITGEGEFKFGKVTGYVYIKVKEDGIEAFGAMSPIRARGFALTGTRPGSAPMMYLKIDPPPQIPVLALNGQLEVLGAKAKTDVYLSDAGFSATLEGRITGGHSAKLDFAGVAFHANPTAYVKASMTDADGLVRRINELASAEFRKAAKNTDRDFDRTRAELKRLRPQLAQRKRELTAKQNQVRADYQRQCAKLDQKKKQEAERVRKSAEVRRLKAEIRQQEAQLNRERYRPAKNLRSLSCPNGWSKHKDKCWRCPGGFKHDILQPWDGNKACFKPRKNILKGNKYVRANQGQSVACRAPLIPDLGRCWQCPSGYVRKVSVFPINGKKGCDMARYDQRASQINGKKARLAALESELTLITKGIGKLASELSGVAANVCDKSKDTEAINADPRVAPAFSRWSTLSLKVVEGDKVLAGTQTVLVGGLNLGAWIAKNGGEAARAVRVEHASFEGCASAVEGGHVALNVRGKLMDRPFSGSFALKLQSPDAAIKAMADTLLANKPLQTNLNSGNCKRPNVPRPNLGDRFGAKLAQLDGSKKKLRPRPKNKKAPRPGWAAPRGTTAGATPTAGAGASPRPSIDPAPRPTLPPPAASLPPPPAGGGQTSCRAMVRSRVDSDYKGGRDWSDAELNELCGNAPGTEPAKCLQTVMHGGVNWGSGTQWRKANALSLCRRSANAKRTVVCFQKRVDRGWSKAIQLCRAH